MVKEISSAQTLPLRSLVLRNGKSYDYCIFPTDEIAGAFHLGAVGNHEIVSIGSFAPNNIDDAHPFGYQLRGMASHPDFVGKGFGSEIIVFAISLLKPIKVDYIWCNARLAAVTFYQKLGFTIKSDIFEVTELGPHYKMKLNLEKQKNENDRPV